MHRTAHQVCTKPSRLNGGGGDGDVTVSKSGKTKMKHCILMMSLITMPPSPPLPLSPQALWRDKSPPRHSCTMESIDDPLTDSQKPSTNTALQPPPPTTSQQLHPNPGPAKAGRNPSSYRAPRASWRQQGTAGSPWIWVSFPQEIL